MARRADALAENAAGELFVDSSCIDCAQCRQLAPAVFARSGRRGQSYVARQPADAAGLRRALMALVTCPTSSIGTSAEGAAAKLALREAARAFPEPVEGLPGILFCGYASADSYGASSWLVRRPDGNVLVDSPRWSAALADRIEELGGVALMVLTHRDDVADHEAWRERFGCERVIGAADVSEETRGCERIVSGEERLAPDLLAIPVPGHTRGSIALLHGEALFTGDHVWGTGDGVDLDCEREVCWYSWPEQRRSIEKLAAYEFSWVLPGHGPRFRAEGPAAMHAALERLARAM